jgi:enoyl-CoA hydratase/carnithine racemase
MTDYSSYKCLKVEVAAKLATVTFNRPEAHHAMNQDSSPSCGTSGSTWPRTAR